MPTYQVEATIERCYVRRIEAGSLEEAIDKGHDQANDREWVGWSWMSDHVVNVYAQEMVNESG